MFGKQTKQNIISSQSSANVVGDDLIVHNMPRSVAINQKNVNSGRNEQSLNSLSDSGLAVDGGNSKIVGLLIIVSGLLLIALIIYFSYKTIIVPALTGSPVTSKSQSMVIDPGNNSADINIAAVATSSLVASSTALMAVAVNEASTTLVNLENLVAFSSDIKKVSSLPLLDTDGDGLYDIEEALIGSSPLLADTDGDSYGDLVELLDGYDPSTAGSISKNSNLISYYNEEIGYRLVYPKSWELASAQDGNLITISTGDDSLIQFSVVENSDAVAITDWYGASFPDDSLVYERLQNTTTWEGVKSADGLNLYLTDKERRQVLVVSYISISDGPINYHNIFKMIVNSIDFQ